MPQAFTAEPGQWRCTLAWGCSCCRTEAGCPEVSTNPTTTSAIITSSQIHSINSEQSTHRITNAPNRDTNTLRLGKTPLSDSNIISLIIPLNIQLRNSNL